MRLKYFCIFLLCVLIFGLVHCGDSTESNNSATDSKNQTSENSVSSDTVENKDAQRVTSDKEDASKNVRHVDYGDDEYDDDEDDTSYGDTQPQAPNSYYMSTKSDQAYQSKPATGYQQTSYYQVPSSGSGSTSSGSGGYKQSSYSYSSPSSYGQKQQSSSSSSYSQPSTSYGSSSYQKPSTSTYNSTGYQQPQQPVYISYDTKKPATSYSQPASSSHGSGYATHNSTKSYQKPTTTTTTTTYQQPQQQYSNSSSYQQQTKPTQYASTSSGYQQSQPQKYTNASYQPQQENYTTGQSSQKQQQSYGQQQPQQQSYGQQAKQQSYGQPQQSYGQPQQSYGQQQQQQQSYQQGYKGQQQQSYGQQQQQHSYGSQQQYKQEPNEDLAILYQQQPQYNGSATGHHYQQYGGNSGSSFGTSGGQMHNSAYNVPPGSYRKESYMGPQAYTQQPYMSQQALYSSYLSTSSYHDYAAYCGKGYGQRYKLSSKDLDSAFTYAFSRVQDDQKNENTQYSSGQYMNVSLYSSAARSQVPSYLLKQNPQYFKEKEAFLMEYASKYLQKYNCLTKLDVNLYLPQVKIAERPLKDFTCNYAHSHGYDKSIKCTDSKYRSIDGSCNNLKFPYWGKSNVCHLRLLPPAYEDGLSEPRSNSYIYGKKLPPARLVSSAAHSSRDDFTYYTHLKMGWGQYINHDISFTPSSLADWKDGLIECCKNNTAKLHPQCLPIILDKSDYQSSYGKQCINFVRSAACPLCSLGPRQQVNMVTSYLDLSSIYGSSPDTLKTLRSGKGGLLLVGFNARGKSTLPPSAQQGKDQCSATSNYTCWNSGDARVNQHPTLQALHTAFHRRHNQHATGLAKVNPKWSDEQLFQEARRINIAEYQHITFNEYLPILFGPTLMQYYNLYTSNYGYTQYEPYTDATTWNDYSTAACRYGHSQISGFFSLLASISSKTSQQGAVYNGNSTKGGYWLRDHFFNPTLMQEGHLDAIIRGLASDQSNSIDPWVADDVKNHLYQTKSERIGSDLISINIQRGRDHGLPAYHNYLQYCFGVKVTGWHDLEKFIPLEQLNVFKKLYSDWRDIDLYSAGIAEKKFPDASFGPTFACVVGIQYYHLKFGDRYFYSHGHQTGSFTPGQLTTIKATASLAGLLCKISDNLGELQRSPFLSVSKYNPPVPCKSVSDIDYNQWKEY